MGKNSKHHQHQTTRSHSQTASQQRQEPRQGSGGGGGIEDTPKPAVGPLETALTSTMQAVRSYQQLQDDKMGEALEMVDAEFHGEGVFHTDAEMVAYLEKRGYQVIQPVQDLDEKPEALGSFSNDTTELSRKFDNMAFDEPDKFRVSRQLKNGNIMVMVELLESYAEGCISESENQEITPGEFLDQRLQEAVENYFVSNTATK